MVAKDCSVSRTRRHVLRVGASIAAAPIGLSVMWSSDARAELATAAAAITIIVTILNSQKRSGDLELELRAVNLKLDAILSGQRYLIEAIGLINANLDRLREVVNDVPSEVIGLQLTTQIGGLTKRLIDTLATLEKNSKQRRARGSYETMRDELKVRVSELSVAAVYSTQTPTLVHAAQQALLAVRLFAKYDRKLSLGEKNSKSDLLNMVGEILQTLELMTRTAEKPFVAGLQRYIAKNREELEALVSAASSSSYQSFVKKLLPTNYERVEDKQSKQSVEIAEVQYCLRGPEQLTSLRHEPIKTFVSETKLRTVGWDATTRHAIQLVSISYKLERQVSFGGRSAYQVRRAESGWLQETWSQTVRTVSGQGVEESRQILQSDPEAKRDACDPLADAIRGAPTLYKQFESYLAFYNTHVAIESRLLWLRAAALQNIETCKALEKELAT